MTTLAELRTSNPSLSNMTDRDLIKSLSDNLGLSVMDTEAKYGVEHNTAGFATDTAVDLARGVVGIGKIATGLGDLASGGAVGRELKATFGGDLSDVDKKLESNYSNNRLEAGEDIQNSKGFVGTTQAYLRHPAAMIGEAVQGLPSMAVPIGVAGKVASGVAERLTLQAAKLGYTGTKAAEFVASGVKGSVANKLATPLAWGGVAGAQAADQQVHDAPDDVGAMYGAAAGSAAVNALGIHAGAMLPGGGAAQAFATKGVMGALEGNTLARTATAVANQGGFNAAINAGSVASANLANGRPWEQGVPEAAASGMLSGGAFGAVHGLMHGKPAERSLQTDGDGNVVINGVPLTPADAAIEVQKQQQAAQVQAAAQPAIDALQASQRSGIESKYGLKETPFVNKAGVSEPNGSVWGGTKYMDKTLLDRAIDAQTTKEAAYPAGQRDGEAALAEVLQARNIDVTPNTILKAGGLISDAKHIVTDRASGDAVLHALLNPEVGAEMGVIPRLTAQAERAEANLVKHQEDMDNGNDGAYNRNKKTADDARTKLAFYNEWAEALKKNGAAFEEPSPVVKAAPPEAAPVRAATPATPATPAAPSAPAEPAAKKARVATTGFSDLVKGSEQKPMTMDEAAASWNNETPAAKPPEAAPVAPVVDPLVAVKAQHAKELAEANARTVAAEQEAARTKAAADEQAAAQAKAENEAQAKAAAEAQAQAAAQIKAAAAATVSEKVKAQVETLAKKASSVKLAAKERVTAPEVVTQNLQEQVLGRRKKVVAVDMSAMKEKMAAEDAARAELAAKESAAPEPVVVEKAAAPEQKEVAKDPLQVLADKAKELIASGSVHTPEQLAAKLGITMAQLREVQNADRRAHSEIKASKSERELLFDRIKNDGLRDNVELLHRYLAGQSAAELAAYKNTTTGTVDSKIRLHDTTSPTSLKVTRGVESRLASEGFTKDEIHTLTKEDAVDADVYKQEPTVYRSAEEGAVGSDVHLNENTVERDGSSTASTKSIDRTGTYAHDDYAENSHDAALERDTEFAGGNHIISAIGASVDATKKDLVMPHTSSHVDAVTQQLEIALGLENPQTSKSGGAYYTRADKAGFRYTKEQMESAQAKVEKALPLLEQKSESEQRIIAAKRKRGIDYPLEVDSDSAMSDTPASNKVDRFSKAEMEQAQAKFASEKALSRNLDGSEFSSNPKIAAIERNKARLEKLLIERERTAPEQEANDAALNAFVHDKLQEALKENGIATDSEGMFRIQSFRTEALPHDVEGYIEKTSTADGVQYHVVIGAHIVERGESSGALMRVVQHEVAHGIDMSPDGGIYSAQPEMRFRRDADGTLRGVGPVAVEILNHFKDGGLLKDKLAYPLDPSLSYSSVRTSKEVFAQVWHLFQNAETRPIVEALLPKTAQYFSEVMNHVQDTPATLHSATQTATQRLARDFGRRDPAGNTRAAERRQTDSGAKTNDASAESRAVNNVDSAAARVTRTTDGATSERLESRTVPAASSLTPVQREGIIESNIKRLPAGLQPAVRAITANISHFSTRAIQSGTFLHDLADWAGKHGMPAMKEVSRLFSEKGAFKSDLDKKLGTIAEAYDALQPRAYNRLVKGISTAQTKVGEYLKAAQFDHENKWGYQPAWRDEKVTLNPKAEAAWSNLAPNERAVVDAIFKHSFETRTALQKAFNERINEMYDDKVSATMGDKEIIARIEKEREVALKEVKMAQGSGAYSPAKRYGNHVVTVRSPEFAELSLNAKENRAKIKEMQSDPAHYQVMHYDSAGEAANKAAELRATKLGETHRIADSEKQVMLEFGTQTHMVLEHMAESAASNADPEFAKAINATLTHAIIKSMSENTARTSELHRKLISGMKPEEMIRAFMTNGFSDNATLSAVLHNRDISNQMKELAIQKDSGTDAERKIRQTFYNEVQQRRVNAAKMQDPAPWVSHAMRFTSVWKLITSPAYYLQYVSQPLTMAAPVIQGDHGYGAGMREMWRGMKESPLMMDVINGKKKLPGADGARLTAMLGELQKTGTISIGHSQQFGQYHNRPEGSLSREWVRATDKMSQLPHNVETHNRVGTALAAYRLEFAKAIEGKLSTDAAHKQATAYARDTINTAYGDYSSYNAPRIMAGGPMRRLAMQYRQFSAIHTAMLVRIMGNMFKGESAEVRKAARHQMSYMAAHYGVLAGAMGIPGAHVIAGAIQGVFGDDDIPEDKEMFIKRHTGDGVMYKLITQGVPGLAGFNLSNRMGAGDILSPFRGDTSIVPGNKKDYKDTALAVMGPFISAMVPQVIDGVDRIGKGDYYRGLEQLMPKGLGDIMKAARFADEGVTNRKGDVTMKQGELSTTELVGQAMGANLSRVADAQHDANIKNKTEQHFKDMAAVLITKFAKARNAGESVAGVEAKWREMQDIQRKEQLVPTPLSSLYTSMATQRKREASTVNGVQTTSRNKQFVASMTGGE